MICEVVFGLYLASTDPCATKATCVSVPTGAAVVEHVHHGLPKPWRAPRSLHVHPRGDVAFTSRPPQAIAWTAVSSWA